MIRNKFGKFSLTKFFDKLDNFAGGTNTSFGERRLEKKFAYESVNLMQVKDGVWETRWGTALYGAVIPGASLIDGGTEYIKADGTRELIAVSTGKVWKSTDGGTWTEVTGATFTTGTKPFFLQIKDVLYITNGVDDLAFYDGTDLTTYDAILEATNLAAGRGAGLASGTHNNWYTVVAVNEIGKTAACTSVNETSDIERLMWADADEYIDVTWDAVTGATGYEVYYGEFEGEEFYLSTTTTNSYKDTGLAEPNIYIETPNDNTTSAPKFRVMEVSGNRIWTTYDPDNPFRVYFSGVGQYLGYFSAFYGGGYIDLEKGGRNKPVSCVHYRDGKGTPMITVLCSSPDGYGTIFQIELTAATIGDTTFTIPAAYKIVGSIGADAPYGVVKAADNILFSNKKGIYSLRNKEQVFNVLATDRLTANLDDKYKSLSQANIVNATGYYKPPRAFFSVAEGSVNNKTMIYDYERRNWTWAWSVGFSGFLEYTESGGTTKFLAVPTSGGQFVEISENLVSDQGNAFYQSYISPLIAVSKNMKDLAKLKEVVFELGNFRGTVTCSVYGLMKNKAVQQTGTAIVTSQTGTSGVGDEYPSDEPLLGDATDYPTTFTDATRKVRVKVNKKIYAYQVQVSSTNADTKFTLLNVQVDGILIPSRAPSSWDS